jgi:hypothetical protein
VRSASEIVVGDFDERSGGCFLVETLHIVARTPPLSVDMMVEDTLVLAARVVWRFATTQRPSVFRRRPQNAGKTSRWGASRPSRHVGLPVLRAAGNAAVRASPAPR